MSIFGDLEAGEFIARYWQKEPLLVRAALALEQSPVDGDTLAGLACEDAVESRLVIAAADGDDWRCEDGPFEEARFANLPEAGWTLLVQGVDLWLPEVAALRERFDFLPRWRLDDVMVSYATRGGGVGPHFDHYDVFLTQVQGTRRWCLGQRCGAHSPLREHPSMKLLETFDMEADWTLHPGDMLYVPAGLAHWGSALDDDCITCSIGFRAPSHRELVDAAMEHVLTAFSEDRRYADGDVAAGADPYRIDDTAVREAQRAWDGADARRLDAALADVLGRLVTEPRDPSLVEPPADFADDITLPVAGRDAGVHLEHHPASRFAYRVLGDTAVLYVDGGAFAVSEELARSICHRRVDSALLADPAARSLLRDLLARGSLLLAG